MADNTNTRINDINVGKGAGEKLHKDSTYCIIIGPTGPRNDNTPEHYRLWIDIVNTDKPLIGADFKTDVVTINGSFLSSIFYIPSGAGAPSFTPDEHTGYCAMYYDTTNNNLYVYNGAWKKVGLT